MSIKIFNSSVFSSVFSGNDYFTENWIMNVYNKIKKSTLLPFYIKREKSIDSVIATHSNSSFYESNSSFTNGNALLLNSDGLLSLDNEINIGKVYELNCEIYIKESTEGIPSIIIGELFSIYIDNGVFLLFDGVDYEITESDIYKIKIQRNHNTFKFIVNNVTIIDVNTITDLDTSFLKLTEYFNVEDSLISNIRITSLDNSKILHWWMLNCDSENKFIDIGLNDYDFFSLFYPVIKIPAFAVRFSHFFRFSSDNIEFMKRFLDSKGISYAKDSDAETLSYLTLNWKKCLNERATSQIYQQKDLIENYSLVGVNGAILSVKSFTEIDLGSNFKIEFLIDLSSDNIQYSLLDENLKITKTLLDLNVVLYITDLSGELHLTSDIILTEAGQYEFKIIKSSNSCNLYMNNILQSSTYTITPLEPILIFSELLTDFTEGNAIDYLSLLSLDTLSDMYDDFTKQITYNFNSKDSLFLCDITRNPLYEARINGLDSLSDHLLSKVYQKDYFSVRDNISFKEVDGELLRLYDKKVDSEVVFVKTGFYDLSWVIGSVSPLSYQTYPITMFNKLPNKKILLDSLKELPLRGLSSSKDINPLNYYLDNGKVIIKELDSIYKDLLLAEIDINGDSYGKEWIVPCMGEKSYEVSFRMEISSVDPDFNIKFGLVGSGLSNVKTNTDFNLFINDYNINRNGYYWVRGIIYGNTEILTDRELGLSIDTENTNHLQFKEDVLNTTLSIKLSLLNNAITSPIISLYDFQFRLLSLPVTKVSLGSKNTSFVYGRNNSINSNDELIIKTRELIPYNMNIKQL